MVSAVSEFIAFWVTVMLPVKVPPLTVITPLALSVKMALPVLFPEPSAVDCLDIKLPPSIVAVTLPALLTLLMSFGLVTARALAPEIFVLSPLTLTVIGFLLPF